MVASGMILAWLAGIGLLVYRDVSQTHRPPPAGALAAASGVFVMLAIVGTYSKAAPVATLMAWGFDVALYLKPGMLPGTKGFTSPQQENAAAHQGHQGGGPI